jgi:hypothetical protein
MVAIQTSDLVAEFAPVNMEHGNLYADMPSEDEQLVIRTVL